MEATEIQQQEIAEIEEFAAKRDRMLDEIRKVIVGQDQVIEEVLIALFARGHCLLVGVPGLAKTLLISTLAEILDLDFNRIQFTPDLMPSDITGTDILQEDAATGRRTFQFLKGPIFTNILLADEINRTPPKTQAALLQSMQEYKVTAGGTTYPLDLPFFVLATQNPIEQEGTYPLPEAQLDRFMLNIEIRYPTSTMKCGSSCRRLRPTSPRRKKSWTARRSCVTRSSSAKCRSRRLSFPMRSRWRSARGRKAPMRSIRQGLRRVGRRAARLAISHPRRQGAHDSPRPLRSRHRGHPGPRSVRAAPPHRAQFQGTR